MHILNLTLLKNFLYKFNKLKHPLNILFFLVEFLVFHFDIGGNGIIEECPLKTGLIFLVFHLDILNNDINEDIHQTYYSY